MSRLVFGQCCFEIFKVQQTDFYEHETDLNWRQLANDEQLQGMNSPT